MKARPCLSHCWNSCCPSCTVIFVKWKSLSQHTEECVPGWPSRRKGKREHVGCHSPSISNHGNGNASNMLEKNRFLVTITLCENQALTLSKMRSQPWREVHKPIQKTVKRTPTKPGSPFLWPLAQYVDRQTASWQTSVPRQQTQLVGVSRPRRWLSETAKAGSLHHLSLFS